MNYSILLLLLSFLWSCINAPISALGSSKRKFGMARLQPGPRPFPIIGNLLELGDKPHQSLTTLSKTYGPLMSLKLGSTTTIVISSSAKQKWPSLLQQGCPQCRPSREPSQIFNGLSTGIRSLAQPQEDLQHADAFLASYWRLQSPAP